MPTETEKQVYLLAQEHCGLKVGDWVKVIRKAKDYEAGWYNAWLIPKGKMVGNVYKISGIDKYGIWINEYAFPFFILEKIEKPAHEFKPFDRVLVKSSGQQWNPDIFLNKCGSNLEYYRCASGSYFYCIPYEGNEHLCRKEIRMNKENKPCPFCGKNDSQDIFCKTVPYYVTCYACDAFGPDAETPEEAWEKWNKRSIENAITERC